MLKYIYTYLFEQLMGMMKRWLLRYMLWVKQLIINSCRLLKITYVSDTVKYF